MFLFFCLALVLVGTAGVCAVQGGGNTSPKEINQNNKWVELLRLTIVHRFQLKYVFKPGLAAVGIIGTWGFVPTMFWQIHKSL